MIKDPNWKYKKEKQVTRKEIYVYIKENRNGKIKLDKCTEGPPRSQSEKKGKKLRLTPLGKKGKKRRIVNKFKAKWKK